MGLNELKRIEEDYKTELTRNNFSDSQVKVWVEPRYNSLGTLFFTLTVDHNPPVDLSFDQMKLVGEYWQKINKDNIK